MPTVYYPSKEEFENTIEETFQKLIEDKLPILIKKATQKDHYTIKEVCELLDCTRRHLQYLRDSGQIGYVKNGRKVYFRAEDLEDFFNKNYIPAEGDEV